LAKGLPTRRAEGHVYNVPLLNLRAYEHRINRSCVRPQHLCDRGLWLLHMHLGLDLPMPDAIADTSEKVLTHADDLGKYAMDC